MLVPNATLNIAALDTGVRTSPIPKGSMSVDLEWCLTAVCISDLREAAAG